MRRMVDSSALRSRRARNIISCHDPDAVLQLHSDLWVYFLAPSARHSNSLMHDTYPFIQTRLRIRSPPVTTGSDMDIPKSFDDRSNFGSVLAEQVDPSSGEIVSRGIIHKASNQTCSYLALFLTLLHSRRGSTVDPLLAMASPPDIKLDLDANDYIIAAGSDSFTRSRENYSSTSRQNILEGVDAQEDVRRAVRRMDLVIMPIVTMFYFLSFLVRFPFITR